MNDVEILRLIQPIGNKLINKNIENFCDLSYSESFDLHAYYQKIPELNPVYKEAIKHRNEVAVHAVKDTFPYDLLKSKAPSQSDDEWKYQKMIYQSYTFPVWGRAENKTKIIGNDQNYSIQDWDEDQKEYFYTNYPAYSSLVDYFFEIVRKAKINFPNQVLLVRPESIPYKMKDDKVFVDDSVKINYIADIVDEFHIADYKEGKYLVVICDEKVKVGDEMFYQFDLYDDMFIYKIVPTAYNDGVISYDIQKIVEHGWGYLPAQKLKGEVTESYVGKKLYNSIFSFAIPDLNDATRLSSNLSMSEYNAAFPTRIRVVDQCTNKEGNNPCSGGQIFKDGNYSTCPKCLGSGTDAGITVTGEIHVKAYSTTMPGRENVLPFTPPMTYVSPPVDIYTHLDKRINDKMRRAFAFMFETEKATKETATGKQLEKEEFYSSLIQFSNELFGLMKFTIEAIGFFMFTKEQGKIGAEGAFKMPTINKPTSFNFRDASDLTAEISNAKLNMMPDHYILMLYEEYAATRFNSDQEIDRYTDFIVYCDRLWSKDSLTVNAMVGRTCTVQEAVINSSLTSILEQIEEENKDLWDMEFKEIKALVIEKAKEIEAQFPKVEPAAAKIKEEVIGN